MKRVCSLLLSLALLLSVAQPAALAAELDVADETAAVAAEVDDASAEEEAEADAEEDTAEAETEAEEVQEETPAAEEEAAVSAAYVESDSGSLTLELSEGTPADGTYTGTATVKPDEYEDFDAYEVQIAFTFADGALTGAELVSTISDRHNSSYFSDAAEGYGSYTGVYDQLIGGSTTVDAVSEATCSSKGIAAAYEDAYAQAVAANTGSGNEETEYTYVLMNIPYDEFYAADVNNDVAVDAFTSATLNKTRTWSLSGGSYHVNEDGSDITGVTFPVKVPADTDLSAYTQITDDSTLEITVTNRGTTSTTTYTGSQALYQADSYSYYVLSSVPSYYKELTVNEDGSFSFGAVVGESTAVTGSAELSTSTSYGDYQLSVDGITDYVTAGTDDVYGVVLHTAEGSDYGLRHLENIWRVSELAFCTGFTTAVHNCPTSSAHYEAIMGQTITSITYYTSAGIYEVALSESVYVPTKSDVTVSVEDAYVLDGQTTFTVDGALADDFDAVYSVNIEGAVVDAENGTITFATDTDLASYTLTISDQSGKYADLTASFSLYNYYYMNVPYSVFYSELNDDGDVDVVTSATTNKAANCKNVYMNVDSDAGTTTIYGVVLPVKISGSSYASVKDLVTDSAADYYVGDALESVPTVYLDLSYSSRTGYSFSAIQSTAEATTATVDATLSSASVWGDYELDLDADYGVATTEVYGAYVTTDDGAQYAMKQSENLWTPSKYYEAAWDTIGSDYYASMEGKTITGVTFITTSGIVEYTLSEALYVTPHMATTPAAEFTSGTTVAITGVAEDAENVTVTVKASGRNGASLTDEAKSIVDGVVTLDSAATDGTTYRVTISSDNYASNIVTAAYTAQYTYVLMNIPYDEFYAADVNNDVAVDAFTSATLNKTRTWSLSGGSYHVNEDGSDITGVTFPVKVPADTDLSAYTQITDDSTLEITVTNRGTTSTTTYTGSQALYQADSYSYYVLSSVPSYYKELTVNEDGSFSFGAVVGESTAVNGSAELSTSTSYGDYQLSVDGITNYVTAGTDDVYGVVLHTAEGSDYGLRHLENIWRVSELAFCTGFTTAVHNCPTSSAHYEAIMGQTITSITYYTSAGIYEVALSESVYVPTKSDVSVTVEDAYVLDGQTTFTVDGTLADDFDAAYSVNIEGAVVDAENGTITFATDTDLASYTLTISDQSGKYADLTASFSLYNYYYMNVPYSVFYGELNDDGDVDVVTSATTNKAANCKNVYLNVDADAGTTTIYGVVVPVKVSGSAYASVKDLVTDAAADYYVGDALESVPTVYLEVTYSSRSGYSFSSIQSTAEATTATVDATLSSSSVWGDYELNLDADYGVATTEVYGAYVTTDDGAQYAMKQSENLWTPSKYYEAAWDTIGSDYYASMEGKTITGVTFITTSGIVEYTLSEALYVTPHMATTPAAEFTSGTTIAITGVAENAENVTVTVKASGRNGASLTDEAKSIVDGVVTLDSAATDGTTYRVTISSDNYASNIVTAAYSVDTAALTAAIETAQALTESNYTADSWAAMQSALADATALAEATTGKTQAEVDEITAALTAAVDALVDTTALTAAIETAATLTESDYTAESWADLETALTAAQTVAANAAATQTEVDEAAAAVTAAISALEKAEEEVTVPAATKITSAVNRAKGVKLTWNAVDDATSYQVYRKIGNGSWKKVKTTTSTTWTDTAATKNGTKYQYKVYAVNDAGKSSASATKTIYRLTAKHFTRAKNVSGKKISLKWTRNTKATGYVIEYSTSKSFSNATTVKVKGNKNVTTTLKNLTKGKTYYIRMRPYKTSGSVTSYAGWSKVKTVKVKK